MNLKRNTIHSTLNRLTSIQNKVKVRKNDFWIFTRSQDQPKKRVKKTKNPKKFFQLMDRVGVLKINTKLVVPLLFFLVVAITSSVQQTQAIQADRYAMSENRTLEEAMAKMALDELLLDTYKSKTNMLEYDTDSFTRTIQLLEILHETGCISLINESVNSAILGWIDSERKPLMAYTVDDEPYYEDNFIEKEINGSLVTMNKPTLVEPSSENIKAHYWWGTLERSLDAARIMKLLGEVPEEVLEDIKGQIKESFGGSDPVWSSTHIDFSKTYAAFVTAYEYGLFDMFEELGYPKLDSEAVTLIDRAGREIYSPISMGDVINQGETNLTFHSGYEQTYNASSGNPLRIDLPSLDEWFDTNLTAPVPYQTISVDWIPCEIPNSEELSVALELGLVAEVYVELDSTEENYTDKLAYFTSQIELEYLPEPENQTIEVYRYYDWNPETLWYEMEVVISDATNGEVIQTTYMNPTDKNALLEMDLSDRAQLQVEINVRQALHTLFHIFKNSF